MMVHTMGAKVDMKIIDSHTHVHSLPGYWWDSPPERLIRLMDEAGIEKSIIMPYGETLPDDLTLLEYTVECVRKYGQRLIGYVRMHPAGGKRGIEVFEKAVREQGMKGLKFHPVGTMIHPADPLTAMFVKKAAELGVPVLFHCGDEEWTLPFQIAKLMEKVPEAKIILGHMGGYFHTADAIAVAAEHRNCYLETSATPDPRIIREAVEKLGPQKVIFGSDGPGCLPALEVEKIRGLNLGREVEEQIFSKNIMHLIGI